MAQPTLSQYYPGGPMQQLLDWESGQGNAGVPPAWSSGVNATGTAGIIAGTTRTQAGAIALTNTINRVDTSTAPAVGSSLGDGVLLPNSGAGYTVVINNTANPIQVYAKGTDVINSVAGATGVPIPPGDVAFFTSAAAGAWSFEAGVGSSGRFELLFSMVGLTAGTTRTQAGATALVAEINRVDTSTAPAAGSTLGDGVVLPVSVAGMDIVVINNTVNPIQVYGNGTDTTNGIAGATGVAIPPGDTALFVCAGVGSWQFEAGVGSSGQLPVELAASNIAAAGSTQATATQLTAVMNKVTTATAGTAFGIKLPAAFPGLDILVENHTGIALQTYGAGIDIIDDVPTATGVVQMDSSVVLFTCYELGKWYSNGLATGYAKNPQNGTVLETMQYADNIAAAGTTQATATQLSAALNNVTTVAAGAGVNLPSSAPGLSIAVQNNGANSLQVYPAQGAADAINGIAATLGIQIHPGTVAYFNCTTAGAWTTEPVSPRAAAYNAVATAAAFTATGANISGGTSFVELDLTGALSAAANLTLPTVAQLVASLHAPAIGTSYLLRVKNTGGGANAWTVVTNTGWTLGGTMAVAGGNWRDFVVTLNTLTTATIQNAGAGNVL